MSDMKYLSSEEVTLMLETARLELRYQDALKQAGLLYQEERYRSQRVQQLLLEDDNDTLRDQMLEDQDEMQQLEYTNEDLHNELAASEAQLRELQTDRIVHERELRQYKTECNALKVASSDTEKLVTEKLALCREVAVLRPELQHLKSQAAAQQNFLAEKLTLERELSAVQVELETEKRALQRLKALDKTAGHGESVMINEIEDLKKELAKEKRNGQKLEREQLKKATEWDTQKETLEGKLEAFRTKLRTTKEQLKEVQDELEKIQTAKFAQSAEATKARMNGANPRKRNVARFDPDMTIGTPGNGGPAKKQRSYVSTTEKSTFSITPFLNKTMSILPESPSEVAVDTMVHKARAKGDSTAGSDHEAPEPTIKPTETVAPITKTIPSKPKAGEPLTETTRAKANRITKKSRLPKVNEEDDMEKDPEFENVEPMKGTTVVADSSAVPETKKTKLFSNKPTIFDDDDEVLPRRTTKKLNLAGLRGSASALSLGKMSIGGKNKVLAEFSPLKKDRKLVL